MNVGQILKLMKVRADDLYDCGWLYSRLAKDEHLGTSTAAACAAIYHAKSSALLDFVAEISAVTNQSANADQDDIRKPSLRHMLITEFNGTMTATLFENDVALKKAVERLDRNHGESLDQFCFDSVYTTTMVDIPPLPREAAFKIGEVDVRFVFIAYTPNGYVTAIYNTLAEVEAAEAEFRLEENMNNSSCTYHEIIVPPEVAPLAALRLV